jgi:hypothetical protein
MSRVAAVITIVCMAIVAALPASASAAFGLHDVTVTFEQEDGSSAVAAGSHPFAMTTSFKVNTALNSRGETIPDGALKNLVLAQAPGFIGNVKAVPPCPVPEFLELRAGFNRVTMCPESTVVGIASVAAREPGSPEIPGQEIVPFNAAVYLVEPPRGSVARIGFYIEGVPTVVNIGLSETAPYELIATSPSISQAVEPLSVELTLWGVPASGAHDDERGPCSTHAGTTCPSGASEVAFLTLPRACRGPLATTYLVTSWWEPAAEPVRGESGATLSPTDCGGLGFDPQTSVSGVNPRVDSASALNFDLEVNDPGLSEPNGRAESDIERVVTKLPEGMTTNPSVASGLTACSEAQYQAEAVNFDPAVGCPDSSKVGSVEVTTPLLGKTLTGSIYIARQNENEFHSLLVLYIVIRDEELGLLIRQAGKVEPDQTTGRLTATFSGIPQLPFSNFHLHFREGERAPLITPATCGTYAVESDLYPYADPGSPVHRAASFQVEAGADGGSCSAPPATASFSAGTMSPLAGSYSPFILRVSRSDGSQHLSSIATTLPQGLLGRLAGIPYCSDAQIAQAASRSGEGLAALEQSAPSCPSASEVGTVTVAAGAGSVPFYVRGRAYLAGPYRGAPLSLEIVTPAIAGPFDLGAVAVRTALKVDPATVQITAESDPIPTILHGLPLDVRSISVELTRAGFTLNPTSCEAKAILGSATTTVGSVVPLSQYFQATNCGQLKFSPKLSLAVLGKTKRTAKPRLKAVLTTKPGEANIARAQVNLPHSEFLEQSNIKTTCTRVQWAMGNGNGSACPKGSIYGRAKAWSPLLDHPLEGSLYLRSNGGERPLPDLVAALDGQVDIALRSKIDSGPNHGIRSTFEFVPDAPVSRFVLEMNGGKRGLLVNSEPLCARSTKKEAIVRFTAQNGKVHAFKPDVGNECKSKGSKRKPSVKKAR